MGGPYCCRGMRYLWEIWEQGCTWRASNVTHLGPRFGCSNWSHASQIRPPKRGPKMPMLGEGPSTKTPHQPSGSGSGLAPDSDRIFAAFASIAAAFGP